MDTITINIANVIGDVHAVTVEDGEKVFALIERVFQEHKQVSLSFLNIKVLTAAFLNIAVGKLYKGHTEEFIREHLSVTDITNAGKATLKRVVDTAKLYYKDPEAMERSIKEILDS